MIARGCGPRKTGRVALGRGLMPVCGGVPPARAESGRIMVLLAGLVSVLLMLVLVVAGVTSMHIERKRLVALTDAAATYAASSVDSHAYFVGARPGGGMPLSDGAVQAAVEDFLADTHPGVRKNLEDIQIASPTGTTDGVTATVTLRARLRPAILPAQLSGYLDGVLVSFTSTAHAPPL